MVGCGVRLFLGIVVAMRAVRYRFTASCADAYGAAFAVFVRAQGSVAMAAWFVQHVASPFSVFVSTGGIYYIR